MTILGISAFYHDSAAALIVDGKIIAAAQEERFTRKKQDASFPVNSVRFCLEFANIKLEDVDSIAFYDKPLLKFERLLETYYAFAPSGFISFHKAVPVWLREKLFHKHEIRNGLKEISDSKEAKKIPIRFPDHHLSHAASAFYPSPFEDAAILTIDGVGEWSTASIGKGSGKDIEMFATMNFPHSVGLLYSAFTYYLGFEVNKGEYKLMGLAPYGNPEGERTAKYRKLITDYLVTVYDDGSIWLDQHYFNYATGLRMVKDEKWQKLFGLKKREANDEMLSEHCDMALAIQQVTEDIFVKMAKTAKEKTGCRNICLAGGVALNSVANGKLIDLGLFDEVYIQPAAGDAGGAIGAALAAYHIFEGKERTAMRPDSMSGSLLGTEYSDAEIELALNSKGIKFSKTAAENDLTEKVSELIVSGNVIGWFQGRMEFGPRALGCRSILADARSPEMQKKVNLKIKYRESFRPFAPILLEEDLQRYFDVELPSPYMLQVHKWKDEWHNELPANYSALSWKEKLDLVRSEFASVAHVDMSGRIQTVSKDTNPLMHQLLSKMKEKTGHGITINTSFNVNNEPIVCSPEDAINGFLNTEMDVLAIGPFIALKKDN
ncbi:MAG: carbamoyltransferase [Flavobacteriales bacterium]|nr:carbamoyltransferase [Flavobacteriales bacterium]